MDWLHVRVPPSPPKKVYTVCIYFYFFLLTPAADSRSAQNLRVLKKHGLEHKMEWGKWAITHGFDGR